MMNFNNRLKVNCLFYVLLVILGIITTILGFIKDNQYGELNYPYFEYLLSTGIVLILIGGLKLKKNLKALLNKTKSEEIEIEASDERNILLAYKSGYYTFIISLLSLYGLSLYLLFTESSMFKASSYLCSFLLIIYLVSYSVIKKIN